MNMDHLKAFLAVYRAGGFASVAKEQDLAPSSISRSIAALENSLNVRLFQRTTRQLTPTQAGEIFFKRISPIVEELEAAKLELTDQSAQPSGRLRVTSSVSFGQMVIAPMLKGFRDLYPTIDLDLISSDGNVDLISERMDIAIRHGRLPDSSLIARKLCDVEYRLVASPDYLNGADKIKVPADINSHTLVSFSYADFRAEWLFRKRSDSQIVMINPSITMNNGLTIRQSIRDGIGIGLLPDWSVQDDIASGSLIELLKDWRVTGTSPESAIWLVYPSRSFIPAKTKLFSDYLLSAF